MPILFQIPLPVPFDLARDQNFEAPGWKLGFGGSAPLWGSDSKGRNTWLRGGELSAARFGRFTQAKTRFRYFASFQGGALLGPLVILGGQGKAHASVNRWSGGLDADLAPTLSATLTAGAGSLGLDLTTANLLPSLYTSTIPTFAAKIPDSYVQPSVSYKHHETGISLGMNVQASTVEGRWPSSDGRFSTKFPLGSRPNLWEVGIEQSRNFNAEADFGTRNRTGPFASGVGLATSSGREQRFSASLRVGSYKIAAETGLFELEAQGVLSQGQSLGIGLPSSSVSYGDGFSFRWSTIGCAIPAHFLRSVADLTLSYLRMRLSVNGSYDIFAVIASGSGTGSYNSGDTNWLAVRFAWPNQPKSGPFFSVDQLIDLSFEGVHGSVTSSRRGSRYLGGFSFQGGYRF